MSVIKKVIVAGSRNYTDYEEARAYIDLCLSRIRTEYDLVILSGGCRGADRLGERYAAERGYPVIRFPADWDTYGRSAGPIRNREMAEASDYVICFWDGRSRGTRQIIDCAEKLGKPVKIKTV